MKRIQEKICDFASLSDSKPRCCNIATRKWGDNWFCDEHGFRTPADRNRARMAKWLDKLGRFKTGMELVESGVLTRAKANLVADRRIKPREFYERLFRPIPTRKLP